jgi:hypothetical protein
MIGIIIPALLSMMFFYGYLTEKDTISKYVFFFLSWILLEAAFFVPVELSAPYTYQPDSWLTLWGWIFLIIGIIYACVFIIRVYVGPKFGWKGFHG